MFSLGSPEVVVLIVLGLLVLVPILVRAAGRAGQRASGPCGAAERAPEVRQLPPEPAELPGVRAAIDRGDWRRAVDLYQEASGLPRARAESAVMAVSEPGPNQTGATGPARPGDAGDRVDEQWPGLPDRNRGDGR